jgi:4-alpha-glucanotransferase
MHARMSTEPALPPQPAPRRRAGILLHPTSLPGADRGGDLGEEALRFIDFLSAAGMGVWQMLPLGPTHADGSPYQCLSIHAGNPGLISLGRLQQWGWLAADDVTRAHSDREHRQTCLRNAYRGYLQQATPQESAAYAQFLSQHAHWLDDYALYQALRQEHGDQSWWTWPAALRNRVPGALDKARTRLAPVMQQVRFEQYAFFRQWRELRQYAGSHGVWLFGDMPIFVAHDSADVWAQRDGFMLDKQGRPTVVAGVPPDYFSATGQRWGNPLYNWQRMQADGFRWWLTRVGTQLELFDLLRIDHFRGFEAYWEIPAGETTAMHGRWVNAPGDALFQVLHAHFDPLPLVAEDLGIITPEVTALRQRYALPGMCILQFAFDGGADNPYLPHRCDRNSVVYTGTHDNDTTLSWFEDLTHAQQHRVREYLGFPAEPMPWPLIRAALASVANLAIIPMQDVLALGKGQRMNTPGTAAGNWGWRFAWEQLDAGLAPRLRQLVQLYGRG